MLPSAWVVAVLSKTSGQFFPVRVFTGPDAECRSEKYAEEIRLGYREVDVYEVDWNHKEGED